MPPPPPRAPFMAARPRGAGRRAGRTEPGARPPRSPPSPRSPLRPPPAPPALPGAAPARGATGSAPRRGGRGDRRAPGGARSNLAGPAPPAARPAPERAKLRAGAGGGGPRRLPGAAEPLRSPSPPLPCPPRPTRPRARPAGALDGRGCRARREGGSLAIRAASVSVSSPMGSQLRPSAKGPLPRTGIRGRSRNPGLLPLPAAPALGWRRGGCRTFGKDDTLFSLKASF